jgi:LysM repeat protein
VVTPGQQWWRTEPDTNLVLAASQKTRELEDERRGLLTRLLGSHWEAADLVTLPRPSRPGIVLDGAILGNLPADAKQALQEIQARTQDRIQTYIEAQQRDGKAPDPLEIAKIRQQSRAELQNVLAPGQLEEFLLRYSQSGDNLRSEFSQLKFFNPTPDEFRQIFRSTDAYDQRLQLLAGDNDPATIAQRKSLEDQREMAIKAALGPERYDLYRRLHDPLYREAYAEAQQAGTPETAAIMYEIKLASADEADRIKADASLTDSQKAIELKKLELEQMTANAALTGKELPPEPAPQPPPKKTYVTRPGDTANLVALLYGVPVNAIRAANPNIDIMRLKPGQSLTIPSAIDLPPLPP